MANATLLSKNFTVIDKTDKKMERLEKKISMFAPGKKLSLLYGAKKPKKGFKPGAKRFVQKTLPLNKKYLEKKLEALYDFRRGLGYGDEAVNPLRQKQY